MFNNGKTTLYPQKTIPENFSIILFRTTVVKFFKIKFGGLIPESTRNTAAVAFPTKPA